MLLKENTKKKHNDSIGLSPPYQDSSKMSGVQVQSFVTAAICINILGNGCIIGFPAVLLPQLAAPGAIIELGPNGVSWIGSTMTITVLLGNFMMPSIMGRLGRRVAHLVAALPAIAGWLTNVGADSFTVLLIGRLLHGMSFGMMLPLRSVVIGEYTSPKFRGAFLMMVSLSQATGIFIVHILGSVTDWQITSLICVSFHFISFIMTLYAPESPSYLAGKGNFEKCRKVFRWLRGDGEESELEDMITAHSVMVEGGGFNILETLKKKEFYKPVLIMINANAMIQFAGGTSMAAYSTLIIGLIVEPHVNVYFWMIFLDALGLISNCLAIYIIKKYKRRTMLFSIGGLCIASHIAIAAYVFARNRGIIEGNIWFPLLLINVCYSTVAAGMVPLPGVIAGEIFPFQYRGVGGSIGVIAWSFFSFLVLKNFPGFSVTIGIEGIYTIYALALIFILAVIWILLPETKGKTLQEIEYEFRGGPLKNDDAEAKQSLHSDIASRLALRRKISMISTCSLGVDM